MNDARERLVAIGTQISEIAMPYAHKDKVPEIMIQIIYHIAHLIIHIEQGDPRDN